MPNYEPIAYFTTESKELYELPSQGSLRSLRGSICLAKGMNHALEDLKDFDYIWVLFDFHLSKGWKHKVFPPRGNKKISTFATRSPHRPNPIGLSCLRLLEVKSNTLIVEGHDLIDQTPVLDIKPYIPFADAFPDARSGWLEEVESHEHFSIHWTELAQKQIHWLEQHSQWQIKRLSSEILSAGIRPDRDRITALDDAHFELACKSWRLQVSESSEDEISIIAIYSGYTDETLATEIDSRWNDMDEHRQFNAINWNQI